MVSSPWRSGDIFYGCQNVSCTLHVLLSNFIFVSQYRYNYYSDSSMKTLRFFLTTVQEGRKMICRLTGDINDHFM